MSKKLNLIPMFLIILGLSFAIIGGCGGNGNGSDSDSDSDSDSEIEGGGSEDVVENVGCPEINLNSDICDPSIGPFTLEIDNPFFPLVVGSQLILEGVDDEGTEIRLVTTVLDETEEVAGITTRVVEEDEFEDGERVETSRNFFAQAPDGTVCYFGEDVDDFEDGVVVDNSGEWRAGENGAVPGIIMPGDPQVGDVFSQEGAPGLAEDQAEIISLGDTYNVEAGTFSNTLTSEDCNPLEEDSFDEKVYFSGIGLAIDEDAELVSF